ncbi:MAG: DUF998 domain-containing protein [Anaerolineaceae bacterium]|nr:DUF998 domain-containing protein [Anaerolineaceae bacterium]MBN2677284.1 DUF998 domain-containing protein [Anaerolineaceae bacterium]
MIIASISYFIAVIVFSHFFAPPQYQWTQNTISDLAAQGLKYQWIMQAGFIGFGVLLNLGFIMKFVEAGKVFYPDLLVMVYGLAILFSGFFSTAPFLEGVKYSLQESKLHSLFATVAGISFTIGIFYRVITAPTPTERWMHVSFLVLVTGFSMLFGLCENGVIELGKGLAQRGLYLVSFIWLVLSQV